MAQHKSAKKSVRKDQAARVRNRSWKSRIKTARRKLEEAIEANKADTMDTLFKEYKSVIDRAVSKGVLHKKTASRRKTVMAQRMKRAGEAPKQAEKTAKSSKAKTTKATESDTASEKKSAAAAKKAEEASDDASIDASSDGSVDASSDGSKG